MESKRASSPIRLSQPRQTAQVWLADGRVYEGPVGTPLEEFIRVAEPNPPVPIVAAIVDGQLRELTYRVESDVEVTPISMASGDGMRIYRRTLSFLLITAAHELFPQAQVMVDHSVPFGGYYCRLEGREPFTAEELAQLEAHMRHIVAEDAPICKERIPLPEAVALFRERGDDDMLRLLAYRQKDYLTIYKLRSFRDCFHGYMLPSTGYLRWFALRDYPPGFILQYPREHEPLQLQPFLEYPKLGAVFREYGEWINVIGVPDVGALNQTIESGRIGEVVLVSEALHEQRIARIAYDIAQRRGEIRLVLIAGPSSSGKTTFAKRLAVQLLANGVHPVALGLDDYFVDRELTPRDEKGEYDFEALEALDLVLFNEQLLRLMDGQEVILPHYNFQTGRREPGETLRLKPHHVILIEGIHGLNPALVPQVPPERIYRIYVSTLTQLNLDRHNRVPTTDTRLIRRIVRDATARGYTAQQTIERWVSVRRGEKRNIFPYQEHADVMVNTALVYELAVLKPFVEPLLLQIERGTPGYVEAQRLLAFLKWFLPCKPDLVPDNSILREFIGGSILQEFRPWRWRNG
ncbi:MAG: nucleoside kinase [Anaerolineae bacterium]|nr:nucleoside kinase [Anaerolineae bacterium]